MTPAMGKDNALMARANAFSCLAEAASVVSRAETPLVSWSMGTGDLAARFLYPGVLEVVELDSGQLLARSELGNMSRVEASFLQGATASLAARFQRDEARRRAVLLLTRAGCASTAARQLTLFRKRVRLSVGMCEVSLLWPGVLEVASAWANSGRRILARSEPGHPDELDTEFAAALRAN